ncbi:MAG TPA: DEAD/DEAH box helicase, partial [Candidatus Thermoplasmatota archaeon]|nr:DEAD/DEAH box helicase [Candidatus Thermoplasmatota archaeon]
MSQPEGQAAPRPQGGGEAADPARPRRRPRAARAQPGADPETPAAVAPAPGAEPAAAPGPAVAPAPAAGHAAGHGAAAHPWPALHPRLDELLRSQGWKELTAPQEAALQPLLDGRHALVVAPTGHGKTEAAMLPVISRMLAERDRLAARGQAWPTGFKALYITPLRALNRDLLNRLHGWGKALGFGIGVRHGDTPPAERQRQARQPPDVLITTPETLQLLLYGDTLRAHLGTVRFVVLDEVHDLLQSERGSQLLVALERLEEVIGQPPALRASKAAERPGPTQP